MVKGLTTEVKKARADIKQIPQDDKVINMKKFEKSLKRTDKNLDRSIKDSIGMVKERFKKVQQRAEKDYKKVITSATDMSREMSKTIQGYSKDDLTFTNKKKNEAKTIRMDLEMVDKKAKGQTQMMENDIADFAQKVQEKEKEHSAGLSAIQTFVKN